MREGDYVALPALKVTVNEEDRKDSEEFSDSDYAAETRDTDVSEVVDRSERFPELKRFCVDFTWEHIRKRVY